ncbi:MAG: ComEC/Rec2 family competence protein [Flavobacteriales bacterium]
MLPFIGGLAYARTAQLNLASAWAVCGALLLTVLLVWQVRRYARRWWRGAAFLCFAFGFGLLWQTLRAPGNDPHRLVVAPDQHRPLLVDITEVTGLSPSVVRCKADAEAWLDSSGGEVTRGGVLLMVRRDSLSEGLRTGDRIAIRAPVNRIDRVADPGGFDRGQWAGSQGIFHEAFVESGNWMRVAYDPPFFSFFEVWRTNVAGWFDALDIAPREKGLVKALILGVRSDIDTEQRDAFARSGTMHVLAVSGMHVGLIYWILMQLMGWWGRRTWARLTRGTLVLASLWAFTGLTGWSPSIVRAAIMFSMFTVSDMRGLQNEPMNSLSTAAFLLLIWDPSMLVQLSFQLSFMAVLGIILFYKPFMRLWSPPNVVLHFIWSALSVTVAAQLMTTPLSLWAFGAFPTWFLPANLLVVTASSAAVIVGIVALVFGHVPLLGECIQWVLEFLLWLMGAAAQWFGKLPGAYPAIRMDGWQCTLLYALIFIASAMVAWQWRRVKWLMAAYALILFIGWYQRIDATMDRDAFVVYDYRDGVLAAMVHGREIDVMEDSVTATDAYARRRIDAHVRKWGLETIRSVTSSAVSDSFPTSTGTSVHRGGLWCSGDLRVRLASAGPVDQRGENTSMEQGQPFPLDVLVLHGPGRFEVEQLMALHAPQHVVLAPDMELGSRRYVRRWCEEHAIHCHDVRRQGAFILAR